MITTGVALEAGAFSYLFGSADAVKDPKARLGNESMDIVTTEYPNARRFGLIDILRTSFSSLSSNLSIAPYLAEVEN